ncbi:MAG: DUF547 domain-containing protein [Nitrospira sp.]|nr:DUF547 domain-containing protein [Nitrospira sp.]
MKGFIKCGIVSLAVILAGCSTVPTSFTPLNPIPSEEFSHKVFHDVVQAHVTDGLVDYPGIQSDARLPTYLQQLDRVDPNALKTKNARLAYWINAYNAFAIKGILDTYSPTSYWGRYRYFIGRDYRVGGETINLYDLERTVLIAQFHEPRIHFAIVCASLSCPKLQAWAYEPNQLEFQLDRVAREFINDPTRNHFDRAKKVASLSMIFKWFEKDFTKAAGSVQVYIARYINDPELVQDLMQSDYRIEYLDYDWSLNGTPPKEMRDAGRS